MEAAARELRKPREGRLPLLEDEVPLQEVRHQALPSAQSPMPNSSAPGWASSPQDEDMYFWMRDDLQRAGERLASDPEWPAGRCWLQSYIRMHHQLLDRAATIQAESRADSSRSAAATGQQEPTVRASLQLLRKEVFSLCPVRLLIVGMMISVILTVISFLSPWVQGKLIDQAMAARVDVVAGRQVDWLGDLGPNIAIYAGLVFGSYMCEIAVGILFAVVGHTTVTRLRIRLFKNLTQQDIAFYDAHVSGELSSRLINDSQALSSLTQFTTQALLAAIVKFTGALVAMFATHPELALIATVITPLNTVLVSRTGRIVGQYGVVQNQAMAKANATAIEVLGSIRTVQSNVGEAQEALRFTERLNYYLRVIKATVYLETVLRFTAFGLSKVRDIVVLAFALHQLVEGKITIGGVTAFWSYVTMYEDGYKGLTDIWINFKQTITSTGKFVQLLLRVPGIPTEGGDRPPLCVGALAMEGVSFAYTARRDHLVLSDFTLVANPGDVIALVGESGAGKSTVGRLLLRYYDPCLGRILLDGLDYRSLSLRWLRAQIGFVEQEPVLFDRSIRDNIAYGSAQGKPFELIKEAARRANADSFIEQLARGYDTNPGERAARISGGQKQRVAIARAVIRDPKVLVLDEATSALDSENEHIVQEALDELMKGKTTVIIAHRLSTVVRASRILVLDKGVVIEQGSHDQLVATEGSRYASFMRHQIVSPLLA